MFQSGVSENVLLLSMRSDVLFTDPKEYTETYIGTANQRDEYERTNYPNGVWIIRLETERAPANTGIVNGKRVYRNPPRWNMGRFRSSGAARKFIESRCNPEEVPVKRYPKVCDCLSWQYMIDYKKCGDIVFEMCRNCGNPTKEIFREPLNALFDVDFDLDSFLGL
jgi:hypothetical protein